MSDITRDDLRLSGKLLSQAELHTMWSLTRPPTDEEFDRLARESGYIKVDILNRDGNVVAIHEWARDWVVENPAKALRALLTDQCEKRLVREWLTQGRNGDEISAAIARGWMLENPGQALKALLDDEGFDRLAREQGYVKMLPFVAMMEGLVERYPTKALRALLTDQCDCMGAPWCNRHNSQYINDGYCERVLDEEGVTPENMEERACQEEDHYACGGRGWLPKDGVYDLGRGKLGREYVIPAEWLEAEDEQ